MCNEIVANPLKSDPLSSKDWRNTLKTVISRNSVHSLDKDSITISDNLEKANVLSDYFRDKPYKNDTDVELPNTSNCTGQSDLILI